MSFHVPNKYRIRNHPILASNDEFGNNGAFIIPNQGRDFFIIASDGEEWDKVIGTPQKWEHVSVHIWDGKRTLTPRWDEMCRVKDIFWDEEDVVIQFHPKKSEYVNQHPNTLHLWRPIGIELPTPPKITVGTDELASKTSTGT